MESVSATYALTDQSEPDRHPLAPGATPRAIRAALLETDQQQFDTAYATALVTAREILDLTPLFETLESWRRTALLQSDRAEYARVVRRAAELLTGQPVPADEPLSVTRTRAGM